MRDSVTSCLACLYGLFSSSHQLQRAIQIKWRPECDKHALDPQLLPELDRFFELSCVGLPWAIDRQSNRSPRRIDLLARKSDHLLITVQIEFISVFNGAADQASRIARPDHNAYWRWWNRQHSSVGEMQVL